MSQARPNRGWIWFFVVVAVLVVASLAGLNWFIRERRLSLEQLQQARAVWDQKGPRDYNLTWVQKGNMPGTFFVKVRNRKAISVTSEGTPLEQRLYPNYTMTALFEFIEDFLREDAKLASQRRTFTTATFDAEDGHVTRFIRRVLGTSEQQDITIDLTLVPNDATAAGPLPRQGRGRVCDCGSDDVPQTFTTAYALMRRTLCGAQDRNSKKDGPSA